MDPSTSALIAGTGLAVAVLALLTAGWAVRAMRRRHAAHLEVLRAAQTRLEDQIARLDAHSRAMPRTESRDDPEFRDARTPDAALDAEIVEAEIVDAEIVEADVEDQSRVPSAPSSSQALPVVHSPAPRREVALPIDRVAREALVRTVGLAHGLRHALSGRTRHRIRYEMSQETKRSRKLRKREVKVAVREYRARQRAAERGRMVSGRPGGENVA